MTRQSALSIGLKQILDGSGPPPERSGTTHNNPDDSRPQPSPPPLFTHAELKFGVRTFGNGEHTSVVRER